MVRPTFNIAAACTGASRSGCKSCRRGVALATRPVSAWVLLTRHEDKTLEFKRTGRHRIVSWQPLSRSPIHACPPRTRQSSVVLRRCAPLAGGDPRACDSVHRRVDDSYAIL